MQHVSNFCKLSVSGPKCPAILFKTTLTDLMVLNFKENPLAQATVPCNNLISHLCIACYFAGIDFVQSFVPQQKVIVAALAKTAFIKHPPKSLVDFICGVQKRNVFTHSICD